MGCGGGIGLFCKMLLKRCLCWVVPHFRVGIPPAITSLVRRCEPKALLEGRFRDPGRTKGRAAQQGKAWGNEGCFRRGLVSGSFERGCPGNTGCRGFRQGIERQGKPSDLYRSGAIQGSGGRAGAVLLFASAGGQGLETFHRAERHPLPSVPDEGCVESEHPGFKANCDFPKESGLLAEKPLL